MCSITWESRFPRARPAIQFPSHSGCALWFAYGIIAENVDVNVGTVIAAFTTRAWIRHADGDLLLDVPVALWILCGQELPGKRVHNQVGASSQPRRCARVLHRRQTVSNFAVLASMVTMLMAAAVVMQWLRPEARPISLWHLGLVPADFLSRRFYHGHVAVLFETLFPVFAKMSAM